MPAALLLLALLGMCSNALAGTFVEAPSNLKVVDDEFIAIFEDGVPDVAPKAKGLAKKYSVELTTSADFKIIKGFAFR